MQTHQAQPKLYFLHLAYVFKCLPISPYIKCLSDFEMTPKNLSKRERERERKRQREREREVSLSVLPSKVRKPADATPCQYDEQSTHFPGTRGANSQLI